MTEAYRLDRAGRLRTDLGGVYFNGIFALAAGAGYFATGQEAFLLVVFVQHMVVLQQLLPLLRFDGYYVLSDLTGVPDILSRIKPIFRSLVPWRRNEPRVDELKPWVRFVGDRVPAGARADPGAHVRVDAVSVSARHRHRPRLARPAARPASARRRTSPRRRWPWSGSARCCCPAAAISLSLCRGGRMALRGLVGWSRGSLRRRAVVVTVLTALATALTAAWWPNGDYEPIRRGERGTIGEAVRAIPEYAVGGPSFRDPREGEADPVPAVPAEGEAPAPLRRGAAEPTPHQTPASPDGAEATTTPAQRDGTAPSRRGVTPDETEDEEEDTLRGDIQPHDDRDADAGHRHTEPHDRGRVDGDPDSEPQHHGRADRHPDTDVDANANVNANGYGHADPDAHRGRAVDHRPHHHFHSPSGCHADGALVVPRHGGHGDGHVDSHPITPTQRRPTMATTQQNSSPHLESARRLLDELSSDVTANADTRAAEAVAHSILVLAEQVAAARLIMAADAANGRAAQN